MGCGCLFGLLGFLWPRLVLLALALLTYIPARAFETLLWPLLGWLFLPTTTLAYALAHHWSSDGRVDGFWLALLAVAFLHDLGGNGYGAHSLRNKVRRG